MSVYWLTFRIHEAEVGGRSQERRSADLNETIRKVTTQWWVESSSFIVLESSHGLVHIITSCKAAIAPSHDLLLVRAMDTKSAYITGLVQDQDIFKLMPYLKKA